MPYNNFPNTNFESFNLDWVIKRVHAMESAWEAYKELYDLNFATIRAEWEGFRTWLTTWFNELDVQNEIDDKINRLIQSGDFLDIISDDVHTTTSDWLTQHIVEGIAIDSSLTVSGAAADSKVTGTKISMINRYLSEYSDEGFLPKNISNYPFAQPTFTAFGITFVNNDDGTVTVKEGGTATSNVNFYTRFPENAIKGLEGEYRLKGCPEGGSPSTYCVRLGKYYSDFSDWATVARDTGDGTVYSLEKDGYYTVMVSIFNGYTVPTDLVFTPSLTRVDIKSNRELSDGMVDVQKQIDGFWYKPSFEVGNGFISYSSSQSQSNDNFRYTNNIFIEKGETIEFYGSGSTGLWSLSEWDENYNFVRGLIRGGYEYGHYQYTADHDMFVRISGKVTLLPTEKNEGHITVEEFSDIKCYYKDQYYKPVSKDILFRKKLTFIGDSLCRGNNLGEMAVWSHILGLKYDMEVQNLGINGNTVAVQSAETSNQPMCVRYNDIEDSDYFVLIGGANDKRLNVPIGEVNSTNTHDFCGALNTIIDGVRAKYPKIKMLFITNYNRYPALNAIGKTDIDYVNAMKEVCAAKCVPCFDNYHNSGMTFQDTNMLAWCDEGLALNDSANHHLSADAYKWLLPVYENALKQI